MGTELHDYGTLVLAALARAGVTKEVGVHRVLAVIIEARDWSGLRAMSWGELQQIVTEALATSEKQYEYWQRIALGKFARLGWNAVPVRNGVADEALAESTLESLIAWNQPEPPPAGCTCALDAVGLGEGCPLHVNLELL